MSECFVVEYETLLLQIMSAFSAALESILHKAAIVLFWNPRDTVFLLCFPGDYSFKCEISFILVAGLNVI